MERQFLDRRGSDSVNVRSLLEVRIVKGDFGESGKLPTIKDLSEEYEVGTTTVGLILKKMVDDNILYSRQGSGYYVRPYSTANLLQKHKSILLDKINQLVKYSNDLGLDFKELVEEIKM